MAAHDLVAAQLLLTLEDTEDRRRYLNARATLNTLLALGCIPVINENDTVATAEIRFGDNDRLAARVAEMVQADQLLLLSDIDGLYTADPKRDPAATHLPVIPTLTPEIEAMGGDPPPGYSSGGMRTKLVAARIATQAGCAMAIALGHTDRPLSALIAGARCTWFLPETDGRSARKRWIAGSLHPRPAPSPSTPAPPAPSSPAAPSSPPASAPSRASSTVATRSSSNPPPAPPWPAASAPTPAPTPAASPATNPPTSNPSSAGAAATNSSTATTSP